MMQTKYCPKCKTDKKLSDFNKDKHTKSGYHGWCKVCQLEQNQIWRSRPEVKEKINKQQNKKNVKRYNTDKKFRDMKKQVSRKYWLENQYGISLEDYAELFEKQHGCCAICGISQSEVIQKLAVDHNHQTGEIRGLLCTNCNVRVGWYENWYKKQKENLKAYLGE